MIVAYVADCSAGPDIHASPGHPAECRGWVGGRGGTPTGTPLSVPKNQQPCVPFRLNLFDTTQPV